MPIAMGNEVATTELQQSIFNLQSSTPVGAPAATTPAAAAKVPDREMDVDLDSGGPHGVKRRREDESDDEGAPMEEGDSDAPMDASSDDDSS